MFQMFTVANQFNQDISGWNVEGVLNMSRMFAQAQLFNQNLANWIISSVTSANDIFLDTPLHNTYSSNPNSEAIWNSWNQPDRINDTNANAVGHVMNSLGVNSLVNQFQSANQFNANIGGWNVERVNKMRGRFARA